MWTAFVTRLDKWSSSLSPDKHELKVVSEWKGEGGWLCASLLSIILSLNIRRETCGQTNANANEKLLFPPAQSHLSIPTINHLHIHHFAPLCNTIAFQGILSFSDRNKNTLSPVSCPQTDFFSPWHLVSESELCVCFSPGLDFEPVGWSLITTEWAANGRLRCSPTADPHPTLSWVSMATCSWVARGLLRGSAWGIMIGRRAWPWASCATWLGIVLISRQFLWHLTMALIY